MNEPRPTPSQQGHPQQPGIRPPLAQGQPAQRPGGVQPLRPAGAGGAPQAQAGQQRPVPAAARPPAHDEEPIALDDDDSPIALEEAPGMPVTPAPPRLAAVSAPTATGTSSSSVVGPTATSKIKFQHGGDKHTYTKFKREAHTSVVGATRVRSFHGRLSDDGLAYTDDKINEWLDNHPEVEIKHVNCLVGPLEGKVTGEQGLIVVIWY